MNAKFKLILAMLIWGSMGLIVKYIPLPSAQTAFIRGLIGAFFLLLIGIRQKINIQKIICGKNKLLLIACGIALSANWIFLFEAYKHTGIAVATLCYYSAPIFIIILSAVFLKEKIKYIHLICLFTALIGIILISDIFITPPENTDSMLGIIYGIFAAISYASLTVMNKSIKNLEANISTTAQLCIASVILLFYIFLTKDYVFIAFNNQTIVLLLILGVVHTGVAFWLFFSSIIYLKAQSIAVISYIDPLTAIILSAFLLNEKLNFLQILGACFILGSAFMSQVYKKRKRAKEHI